MRQVLTETTVLAVAGGALGLLVARAGVDLITAFFGEDLPQAVPMHVDWQVLAFTSRRCRWPPAWQPVSRPRCVSRGRM